MNTVFPRYTSSKDQNLQDDKLSYEEFTLKKTQSKWRNRSMICFNTKRQIFDHSKICEIADKVTSHNEGCLYVHWFFFKAVIIILQKNTIVTVVLLLLLLLLQL